MQELHVIIGVLALFLGVPLVITTVLLWVMIRKFHESNKLLIEVVSREFASRANWVTNEAEVKKSTVQWEQELGDESDQSFGRLDYASPGET